MSAHDNYSTRVRGRPDHGGLDPDVNAQALITERDFQATVIDLARQLGWMVGFTHDSRKSEPGEPDLRMVHRIQHRVIFAELKTVKGKLTKGQYNKSGNRWLPGQDEWGQVLSECPGVEYYLWRPDGLDGEIERILR